MSTFSGTTEECIGHFTRNLGPKNLAERKTIAQFAGVNDDSVRRWLKGQMHPTGEPLVRLRFYLEFLGYEVAEVELLNPIVRNAARLFAFRVADLSEIAKLLGYADGRNGLDDLLRMFRGGRGVSKKRLEHIQAFVDMYEDQLDARRNAVPKIKVSNLRTKPTPTPTPLKELGSLKRPGPIAENEHDAVIKTFAGLATAILPLADLISSDSFTEEERARVRELAGGDGVFLLANRLFRICGPRARQHHSK